MSPVKEKLYLIHVSMLMLTFQHQNQLSQCITLLRVQSLIIAYLVYVVNYQTIKLIMKAFNINIFK